ncbi:eukaryotic translation initiation factor 2B beta subunit [Phanerochaete sordida]|uniref:Translation initiation factor eIF2B subunit beta n=1 Tax=Phanerochaete sordida TaxID=48140 RepID=A0A9P3GIB0_9APHY|nr:eukaryotic translation initiation factor 2B beta subunit [Phanerochaete sordida]
MSDPAVLSAINHRAVDAYIAKLRRRQVVGSREAALETLRVLRQVVSKARFSNIEQLTGIIRGVGGRLVEAQPKEHSVGNTIRKILHHVRDEYNAASKATKAKESRSERTEYSLANFISQGQIRKDSVWPTLHQPLAEDEAPITLRENDSNDPDSFAKVMKPVVMDAIQDVLDELETVYDNIAKTAREHINPDEIILTIGHSKTVEAFLKAAAHYRSYTVIVAETGPSYSGHTMAKALSAAGISTFLVPDSSIYALMSRVTKVVLGAHAILATGGMFAITGSLLAATAARTHSTPVVVCAGQFKFTPLWNLYHEYGALDFADPSSVLGFEEGALVDKVEVLNPYYDYVAPDLVDVFVTNDGDHPPSSIYRLIKETYDDEDTTLEYKSK